MSWSELRGPPDPPRRVTLPILFHRRRADDLYEQLLRPVSVLPFIFYCGNPEEPATAR